jgi:ubiquinone biosynthesis monooxygenase Coq7
MLSEHNEREPRLGGRPKGRADANRSTGHARVATAIAVDLRVILEPSKFEPRLNVLLDSLITAADSALRTLSGGSHASRAFPRPAQPGVELDAKERRLSGALMRVNHVGEVCAQALYSAQALTAKDARLRRQFEDAAKDETDHLAWTQQRLHELGARPSLLNPIWYGGAFAIGLLAGRASDALSLGFVVETERQVEQHLDSHLQRLPAGDNASRAVVRQMKNDEARHAGAADAAGAVPLPLPVRWAMRAASRVMTGTAHYI